MRKILCMLAVLCCACALCLAFVGCGAGAKSQFAGEWSIQSATDPNYDQDSLDLMESLGLHVTLVLNADGTGTLDQPGGAKQVSWEPDGGSAARGTVDGAEVSFAVEDGALTVSGLPAGSMTFARVES